MMVKKLKHLLTKKGQSSLLSRSAIYLALLSAFVFSGSLIWAVFFGIVGIIFYSLESRERKEFKISYLFSFLLPALVGQLLITTPLAPNLLLFVKIATVLVASVLFYLLSSVIQYSFKNRDFIYTLVNTTVFIFFYTVIFSYAGAFSLGWISILLVLGVLMLFSETLKFNGITKQGFSLVKNKRSFIASTAIAIAILELSWVSLLLPLGIINMAVFITLVTVVCRDILLAHFEGKLTLSFLLQQFTFLVLLVIIIFASSNWSI